MTRDLPRRLRRACAAVAAACVTAGALVACGPAAVRADDVNALRSVSDHLDASASAVATARLAVRARATGRLPSVTADATVAEAAETATGAVHGIGTLTVAGQDAAGAREEALDAASGAVGPIAAVRTWLGGPPSAPDDVLRALDDAATALDDADRMVRRTTGEVAP